MQRDVRMVPGDFVEIADYEFQFLGVERVDGPNFTAYRGDIRVTSDDQVVTSMQPEKRNYKARGQVMTEAAIDATFWRDLYVSLGEPLAGQAWAIRLQVKPFVRCIWLGGIMAALGGFFAAFDRRYRRRKRGSQLTLNTGAIALD